MTVILQNTSNAMQIRTIVFFVLFLLSSFGMFGQEVKNENDTLSNSAPAVEVVYDSEADLVNWFMSSKQNTINNEVKGDSATTTKKQIITSGSQPNKVLYRTFVKRIAAKDTAIV
jgi:hypothetical protein